MAIILFFDMPIFNSYLWDVFAAVEIAMLCLRPGYIVQDTVTKPDMVIMIDVDATCGASASKSVLANSHLGKFIRFIRLQLSLYFQASYPNIFLKSTLLYVYSVCRSSSRKKNSQSL